MNSRGRVARFHRQLIEKNSGNRFGIEFKRQDAPKITKSMRQAIQDLDLEELWIVYPGSRAFQLDEKIHAKPLSHLLE